MSIWAVVAALAGLSLPIQADEPTLARLSFWIPAAQIAGFESAYAERLKPLLEKHGLNEASQRSRVTADTVFTRLFEIENPAAVADHNAALNRDSAWQETLVNLGSAWTPAAEAAHIRHEISIYSTPAGSGTTVTAGAGFRQGPWHSFSQRDGLAAQSAFAVFQDRNGHLWFGTSGGVTRYDGHSFTSFTSDDGLAGSHVQSIFQDREGFLWFGTPNGLSRYDGKTFITFTAADGLTSNQLFQSLFQDREGDLWFGTRTAYALGRVTRYDGRRFATFSIDDGLDFPFPGAVAQDREGNMWFSTVTGVSKWDGSQFTTFTTAEGPPVDWVTSILEDRAGDLWIGHWSSGVTRYDGHQFTNFTTDDGLAHNRVMRIWEDEAGDLWMATGGGGVSRYNGHSFTNYTTTEGLASTWVTSIHQDRDGYLWFATNGGVSRFDAQTFKHVTTDDGLPSAGVNVMIRDRDGALWFGTEGGLSRYDGNTLTTLTTTDGLAHNSVFSVVEDREGHLWIGTPGGVDRYDGREFKTFATWKSTFGTYIFADQAGHLWFEVRGEPLRRYDGKQLTETTAAGDPIHQDVRRAHFQDRAGRLWFRRRGGGLILYDGEEFTTLTTADGLAVNGVPKLEDRDGNVWLGLGFPPNRSGAGKYDGERLTTITTREGLAANDVRSILQDPEGRFWFGTFGGGVSLYDGLVFQNLSRRDGLLHDTVNEMLQDANGDVWIGTEGGVSRYRPRRTPPSIHITDIVTDRRLGPVDVLQVPETQDLLVFEFRGGSFSTPPDRMVYVYQLEEHDEERRWTRENRVEYTDIATGDYTFQVQAVDRDLNYSDPVTVRVSVHPAYGRIALVIALLLGVTGTVAGTSVAIRRRKQRDQAEHERDDARTELVKERRRLIQAQPHSIERWTVDEFVETS